jgi:hypothetical protein
MENVMASSSLEKRVAALEEELAVLRRKIEATGAAIPWWERIAGTFAHDPVYAEAMKLGRKYRESLRPKRWPSRKKIGPRGCWFSTPTT